jgi:death-on-curing protein
MAVRYLAALDVIAINATILTQYQETPMVRDQGGLEGAIMRPQMAAHYENADLMTQAALLMQGIALAHAFVDGNKRTALIAGVVFLHLNGFSVASAATEFGQQIESLVRHQTTSEAFTVWLRERLQPRER